MVAPHVGNWHQVCRDVTRVLSTHLTHRDHILLPGDGVDGTSDERSRFVESVA